MMKMLRSTNQLVIFKNNKSKKRYSEQNGLDIFANTGEQNPIRFTFMFKFKVIHLIICI